MAHSQDVTEIEKVHRRASYLIDREKAFCDGLDAAVIADGRSCVWSENMAIVRERVASSRVRSRLVERCEQVFSPGWNCAREWNARRHHVGAPEEASRREEHSFCYFRAQVREMQKEELELKFKLGPFPQGLPIGEIEFSLLV